MSDTPAVEETPAPEPASPESSQPNTQELRSSIADLYVDDEPTADAADPNDTQDDATPTPEADEPEPSPEAQEAPETPESKANLHNRDAGLTRLQQQLATEKREAAARQAETAERISGIESTMAELLEAVKATTPTPAAATQETAIEAASTKLDELLAKITDEDEYLGSPIAAAFKALAADLEAIRSTKTADPAVTDQVTELQKALDDLKGDQQRQAQQAAQARQVQEFWDTFERDHPAVKGQTDDLLAKAATAVDARNKARNLTVDGDRRKGMIEDEFYRLVEQAESAPHPPAPEPDKKKTTRSTEGTQTVRSGASPNRPVSSPVQKTSLDELYVPEVF